MVVENLVAEGHLLMEVHFLRNWLDLFLVHELRWHHIMQVIVQRLHRNLAASCEDLLQLKLAFQLYLLQILVPVCLGRLIRFGTLSLVSVSDDWIRLDTRVLLFQIT